MSDKYILRGHTAVPEPHLMTWARWFETADRKVGQDTIGRRMVSTVFLGLDHNFIGEGPPVLFETMVFQDGDELPGYTERYCTWEEAEAGHRNTVALLRLEPTR